MSRSTVLWILAVLLTLSAAVYQRMTGPTYPMRGSVLLDGEKITYRMVRSHGGQTNQEVEVPVGPGATQTQGTLSYKRYKTDDSWTDLPMVLTDGKLKAELPGQPPAGKLEYRVTLKKGAASVSIPEKGSVIIRFKGEVWLLVLIPHVIAMFGAMLLSARAGLEVIRPDPKTLRNVALRAFAALTVGGLIFGPIMQYQAFGAFWTGFPWGYDLTDNKTAIAWLFWAFAMIGLWRGRFFRELTAAAAIVTFGIYLIPHSVLGSELDYKKLDAEKKAALSQQQ